MLEADATVANPGCASPAPKGERQGSTAEAEAAGTPHANGGALPTKDERPHDGETWRFPCSSSKDDLYALRSVTEAPQAFAAPAPLFSPGPEVSCHAASAAFVLQRVAECRVLVVGAGGLGCELLKTLCLSGFRRLSVLDMDTVSLSNLHRQFLFRDEHVGQPKAAVAAQVLNELFRHLGVQIEAHCCKLQEKPPSFFRGFGVVIGGLDCVETRRWLNARMHELVERDSTGSVVVEKAPLLLDGGTEEYCLVVQWVKEHPNQQIDLDNPDHLNWLFEASKARAEQFGIEGVTYRLTTGVSKASSFNTAWHGIREGTCSFDLRGQHLPASDCIQQQESNASSHRIVPAVASTNAVVAALLVQEAFRFKTFCCCSEADRSEDGDLENYVMQIHLQVERTWTLQRLLEELQKQAHLNKPSMRGLKVGLELDNPCFGLALEKRSLRKKCKSIV
ncbi:hypothetical protein Emag_006141 [Eimeria magna]